MNDKLHPTHITHNTALEHLAITGCHTAARAIRAGILVPSESAQIRAAAIGQKEDRSGGKSMRARRLHAMKSHSGRCTRSQTRPLAGSADTTSFQRERPACERCAFSVERTSKLSSGGRQQREHRSAQFSLGDTCSQAPCEGRGGVRDSAACAGEQRCQAGSSPISVDHELAQKSIRRP